MFGSYELLQTSRADSPIKLGYVIVRYLVVVSRSYDHDEFFALVIFTNGVDWLRDSLNGGEVHAVERMAALSPGAPPVTVVSAHDGVPFWWRRTGRATRPLFGPLGDVGMVARGAV
jgi:hypothetical protein